MMTEGQAEDVFENVSFRIDTDWKLGLIGRNGRCKAVASASGSKKFTQHLSTL